MGGRGNPWPALAAGAGALALRGKLSDGSARRDVGTVINRTGKEALAVVLAVAIIASPVSVSVDGHERLAVFSFAQGPVR